MERIRRSARTQAGRGYRRRLLLAAPLLFLALAVTGGLRAAQAAGFSWPQFNGDAQHSGNNTQETLLTLANVSTLQPLFRVTLPAVADSSPVTVSGVNTAQGIRDLVFLTTKAGHILALDAHTGATIWSHQNGPGSCQNQDGACYTTSSPAIDPGRQYVYSYGLDGYVHKYRWGRRRGERRRLARAGHHQGGGGERIGGPRHRHSQAATSYLYASNGGYPGDFGDYQGHVTAINLADGSQNVFNTVCSNQTVHFVEARRATPDCAQVQTAVWARPGVVYDPDTGKIYLSTGNGTYQPSGFDWGDTVLALQPDGTP